VPHHTELIATIAVGLSAACIGGLIAHQLRLPPIVGYLLAGVAVGPFTPGFVADAELAPQLAEIGVILLMFGVGIHFSIGDLFAARRIALPGAIGQVAIATGLGTAVVWWWGWKLGEGIVLGLALSVASTVVLLRMLEQRSALASPEGRVAVGWLVVEDLVTVVMLVMLPILATSLGGQSPGGSDDNLITSLAVTLGKAALFVALMLIGGVRVIPWLLAWVERTGSRELFILVTLAIALGIAYVATALFGVSFALGAFLAGVVVNESELSHRAAEEALPLRDAFAVLFFVSVGMLIDPRFLIAEIDRVLVVVAVVVLGKGLAALLIVRALGGTLRTGLVVAAGLSQIGEFSFILAEVGRSLDLLPAEGRSLILAAALVSITLNPLLFRAIEPIESWLLRPSRLSSASRRERASAP
jgi:CPA2 family monovalent cation:H+ antiporter-2